MDELSCLAHHPVLVITVLLVGGLEKCPDVRLVDQSVCHRPLCLQESCSSSCALRAGLP